MRVSGRRACVLVALLGIAACRPADPTAYKVYVRDHPPGAPSAFPAGPVQPNTCAGSTVDPIIRAAWPTDQDWALRIVHRESRCNPGAINRSSGALGLFQLVGHGDLLWAVCPYDFESGVKAHCNAQAARLLYNGSGRAPWGG